MVSLVRTEELAFDVLELRSDFDPATSVQGRGDDMNTTVLRAYLADSSIHFTRSSPHTQAQIRSKTMPSGDDTGNSIPLELPCWVEMGIDIDENENCVVPIVPRSAFQKCNKHQIRFDIFPFILISIRSHHTVLSSFFIHVNNISLDEVPVTLFQEIAPRREKYKRDAKSKGVNNYTELDDEKNTRRISRKKQRNAPPTDHHQFHKISSSPSLDHIVFQEPIQRKHSKRNKV
jgi:hypothetical protein